MRYADHHCTCTKANDPLRYVIVGPCVSCKKPQTVEIPAAELSRYRRGALIQTAMPSLTPSQREFLISGLCEPCFDKHFTPLKEDDNS